jgi:hypothetical protein
MRTVNHILVHHLEAMGKKSWAIPLCEFRPIKHHDSAPDLKIRCPKCRRRCA